MVMSWPVGAGNGSASSLTPSTVTSPTSTPVERAEAGLGVDLLGLGALDEVEERLGRVGGLVVGDHGAGVLDLERGVGHDVVDLGAALLGLDGLVLVGEEHVADAAGERGGRVAAAAGLGDDLLVERLHVLRGVGLVAALGEDVTVGGEGVPLGRAGRGRVGGDDLGVLGDQVVPGRDPERVARAGDDDDDRRRADAVGVVVLPVLGDEALAHELGDVGLEAEVGDRRRLAADDLVALLAGGAVGGVELERPCRHRSSGTPR